jgi:hypothetical protein
VIALAQACGGGILDLALALDPPVTRDEDVVVFRDDELFFGERALLADALDDRAALAGRAEARRQRRDLLADDRPDPA